MHSQPDHMEEAHWVCRPPQGALPAIYAENQVQLQGGAGSGRGRVPAEGEGSAEGAAGYGQGGAQVRDRVDEVQYPCIEKIDRCPAGLSRPAYHHHGRRYRGQGQLRGGIHELPYPAPQGHYQCAPVEALDWDRSDRLGPVVPRRIPGPVAGQDVHEVLQGSGGRHVEWPESLSGWDCSPQAGWLAV